MPGQVVLRIPHPYGKRPVNIIGGTYDYTSESVSIMPFNGKASIKIEY
jgi:hypothetical protein